MDYYYNLSQILFMVIHEVTRVRLWHVHITINGRGNFVSCNMLWFVSWHIYGLVVAACGLIIGPNCCIGGVMMHID